MALQLIHWLAETALHETALFAASGFFILGLSDLAVDLIWLRLRLRPRRAAAPPLDRRASGIAVFIPAWDESSVIGPMLRGASRAFGDADVRVYVGCYPNDPETIAAVAGVDDPRVRAVIGPLPGPTTKAECLNRLWERLIADEARGGNRADAILLHDAEDVVHPDELALVAALAGDFDLVQIPVLPLIDRNSRWIGAHYADEFAESHGKELVVRQALGAGLPSAGVGCAFSREALAEIALCNNGGPFDAESVTEDYELGLKVAALGGRSAFVRRRDSAGRLIATREYFPGTFRAAVAQKSRWTAGIALSGWDRLGWRGGFAERWMRLRDRQAPLAALLLLAGYVSAGLWLLLKLVEGLGAAAPSPLPPRLAPLFEVNLLLLAWRMAWRCAFVSRGYGIVEGLRSIPRTVVGNFVTMAAAWAAIRRYRTARRTGRAVWGKTAHMFPVAAPE
jgi:bacteriophage N4 adsorption protein B